MKHLVLAVTSLTLTLSSTALAQHTLWYQQPAADWNQALPVGNGRMGAMVFGDAQNERIQLNEDSVWAGEKKHIKSSIGTPADLAHIRKLVDEDKLPQADSEIMQRFSRGAVLRSHQTLGDLRLKWEKSDVPVSNYRRELDLTTGIATSTWKRGQTTYTQHVFCSNPDEGLFIQLTADGPETINLGIELDRPSDKGTVTHKTVVSSNHSLSMTGQVTQKGAKLNGKPVSGMLGMKFQAHALVNTSSGTITAKENSLSIANAKTVTIRLTATTDFWSPETQEIHLTKHADRVGSKSSGISFNEAKKKHIADHQALYNRCALTLPSDPAKEKQPFDKRLSALTPAQSDPQLEALIFHYGRYLLIASSRSNGNPANLQGLWNPHIEAPWNCDYHLNINLQMNYWPAEVANLSETHLPVFKWMKSLARNGVVTAREQYGMRGWMAHHATELYAQTVMKSSRAQWGGWIHGGGWMCQHLWTHYSFTEDEKFLKNTGYPLLAGHSRFYLDWLTEKDGKLISYPESSPENGFKTKDGKFSAVCAKAAMGQQIIHEVFTNTLASAEILGIDNELTREIATALPKLDTGLHIAPDGRILEWDKPRTESEKGHRHLSHLYAFHPGNTITHEKTPELMEAAKKSINFRTKHGSVGIGWSRSWAISIFARLRDGDTAHKHLHEMLRTQTTLNGFNSVFGKGNPVFQIEANLGATAGIAEMLVQSHGDFIHLLPALPSTWQNGSVKGLKARGNYTVDLTWKDGELTSHKISHPENKPFKIKIGGGKKGGEKAAKSLADRITYAGVAINNPDVTTWGATPIKDEKGTYHLYNARWPSSMGVTPGWMTHSSLGHFTSKSPLGPFKFEKTVIEGTGKDGSWEKFAPHNPLVKKFGDTYVLIYIARNAPTIEQAPRHGSSQRIGIATSKSPYGPWKRYDKPILSPSEDPNNWTYQSRCGVNNPALLQMPNGKFHLYFKAIKKDGPWKTKMGLAIADKFEGPYTIQKDPVTANDVSIEDGYVFLDKEGVVNFITTDNHGIIEKGGGLLWKSKDGMKFGKPTLAYHRLDTYIKKSDYPKAKTIYGSGIWKLERPQILVENGEPKYLYAPSGISLDGDKGTESHVLEIK